MLGFLKNPRETEGAKGRNFRKKPFAAKGEITGGPAPSERGFGQPPERRGGGNSNDYQTKECVDEKGIPQRT